MKNKIIIIATIVLIVVIATIFAIIKVAKSDNNSSTPSESTPTVDVEQGADEINLNTESEEYISVDFVTGSIIEKPSDKTETEIDNNSSSSNTTNTSSNNSSNNTSNSQPSVDIDNSSALPSGDASSKDPNQDTMDSNMSPWRTE